MLVMKNKELLELIKKDESQNLEFKQEAVKELGKTVCAFANTDGGVILSGVDDKGEIKNCEKKVNHNSYKGPKHLLTSKYGQELFSIHNNENKTGHSLLRHITRLDHIWYISLDNIQREINP
jgi:predicted HTH transcriptional regulator